MPRQPRLDAPGLLQHVMARGIERRQIFQDDKDRKAFLTRFADILEETQTQCYAWALIPNHFHLLLRTGSTPLSKVMRRLMTGYAVNFNKRHKRSGHLFQNRYKSVVCEEDPYLLELIRYIHLNPLRAGLVKDLRELDKYPWSGHSVIMGRRKNPLIRKLLKQPNKPDSLNRPEKPSEPRKSLAEKTVEDVFLRFNDTIKVSRRRYRNFVKKGIEQGARPDLQGGGLVRSAGGDKRGLLGRKREGREWGDERILGSGDFVSEALSKAGEEWESQTGPRPPLEALIEAVAEIFEISSQQLKSRSRKRSIVDARSVFARIAVRNHGYKGTEVSQALSFSLPSVSRIVENGENILDNRKEVAVKIANMEL
jgi:putative transposase